MKKSFVSTLLFLTVFGCSSVKYVQVFETNTTNTNFIGDLYVFENDSLKITYGFWKEKGLMNFTIYNKSDKPLYIDWKKCAYIDNSVKLSYWVDEEITKSMDFYGSYFYAGSLLPGLGLSGGSVSSTSAKVKVERITFIPPFSNITRAQFYILPIDFYKIDKSAEYKIVPRDDDPKVQTKVYIKTYTKEDSPINFRNFLTFSCFEDFRTEFYVDNEFYICKMLEMDSRHFGHYKRDESVKVGVFYEEDEDGIPIVFSNFQKNNSFFLNIPKYGSIVRRR